MEDDVLYCPACGKKLPGQTVLQGGVPPPPPPTNMPYYAPNAPPVFGEADAEALHKLAIFAVIILVSLVLGFSAGFLYNPFSFLLIANPASVGSTTPAFSLSSSFLTYFAIVALAALVVEMFTFLELRSAFKTLSTVDRPHFKTPSLLTLLLVIALPIAIVGVIIEFAGLIPYINTVIQQQQAGQTVITPPLSGLGEFLAGAGIGFIGGIIAIIGFIGGLILGVWRMGSRYDETLFKVAAILFIIPLVDVISPILILIGVSQVRKKLVAPPAMS